MKNKEYYQEIMKKLNYGMAMVEERYASIAASYNVTYNQLMIIYIMMENPKVTQTDICRAMYLPKSTVHSIVISMQKQGLIALKEGNNSKEKWIEQTEKGKKQFSVIFEDVRKMETELIKRISEDDMSHLLKIVDQIGNLTL